MYLLPAKSYFGNMRIIIWLEQYYGSSIRTLKVFAKAHSWSLYSKPYACSKQVLKDFAIYSLFLKMFIFSLNRSTISSGDISLPKNKCRKHHSQQLADCVWQSWGNTESSHSSRSTRVCLPCMYYLFISNEI